MDLVFVSYLVQRIGKAYKLWNSKRFYSKTKSKDGWDTLKNSQGLPELACSRAVIHCLVSRRRAWVLSFSVSGDGFAIHKPFFCMSFPMMHQILFHVHAQSYRGIRSPLKGHSEVTICIITHMSKTISVWIGLFPPVWIYPRTYVLTKGELLWVARWPQVKETWLLCLESGVLCLMQVRSWVAKCFAKKSECVKLTSCGSVAKLALCLLPKFGF